MYLRVPRWQKFCLTNLSPLGKKLNPLLVTMNSHPLGFVLFDASVLLLETIELAKQPYATVSALPELLKLAAEDHIVQN